MFILCYRIPRANRRIVNSINATSSDECMDDTENFVLRKKMRKRRKARMPIKKQIQNIETISDGESHSDEIVGVNDSDCSDTQLQSAMLGHLHTDGPFLGSISDSHLIDLLSGAENDGSYSSPLSNKSEKNMADFEDEDSPCEEELAQLAASSHCLALTPRTRPISISDHFQTKGSTSTLKTDRTAVACKVMESVLKESEQLPYRVNEICQPGNTLLWDLLMDDKIVR